MLVCIHVVQSKASSPIGFELRLDFGRQLPAPVRTDTEANPSTQHVVAKAAIGVHQVGDLLGRQGRTAVYQDEV